MTGAKHKWRCSWTTSHRWCAVRIAAVICLALVLAGCDSPKTCAEARAEAQALLEDESELNSELEIEERDQALEEALAELKRRCEDHLRELDEDE